MPRLRRARTPEEAAAVPVDKPLVIQLGEAEEIETPEKPEKPEQERKPAPPEPEPELEPFDEPEEPSPLQKQVDDLRRAEELQRQALAQRDAEIARLRRSQEDEAAKAEQAQYDTVVIALNSAQGEMQQAQRDLQAAYDAGDTAAIAANTGRMGVAAARVDRLETDKGMYDARREEMKKAPAEHPVPQDFESRIAALPENGKAWLRARPEYINDQEKNRQIIAVHEYVTTMERKPAWTPEYFQALETHLGLKPAAPAERTEQRRSPPVSAPVSRETPNLTTGRPQRRDIHLTAEQREAARIAGVDDFTYAKGVQELERRKKLGMYPDHG